MDAMNSDEEMLTSFQIPFVFQQKYFKPMVAGPRDG